jgi:neopullulanase
MVMKKCHLFLLFFLCLFAKTLDAQLADLERIEPMFWWTGMKNPKLQLIVHGNKIAEKNASLNYPGVKLIRVNKVENPNYVFLDLEISSSAKPGSFKINFSSKNGKAVAYTYVLKSRDKSPGRIQGVTSKDLIYLIMPDRFSNGDKTNDVIPGMEETTLNRDSMYYRHGGDIQGIINHLDYIKELGITTIWNTPELENDQPQASYHGYAVTDHYKIDPRYGTNELYKTFVEKCHAMGLKVIKDVVHNHIGSKHWLMKDMPFKDWIHQWPAFTKTTYRDHTLMDPYASAADKKLMTDGWFDFHMPDLNQSNPYVQNYLNQNHIWWIEYAGIDGLRLDTYPYNDLNYMADWALKMKAEFPRLSFFGETLVGSVINQAFFTDGKTINQKIDTHLPGITDVQVKDGIYETLNGKFDWTSGASRLYGVLANDFVYQDPMRNVIFMDNHDMHRYYSMIDEDIEKFMSGMAILLTMRGIPQVYYGTEILMKNFSRPDGMVREDFKGGWEGDTENKFTATGRTAAENEAFDFIKKLANYRKNNAVLQTGSMMQYVPEKGIYVYFRYNNQKTVMVIVNSNEQEVTLPSERFYERIKGLTKATDVITGTEYNSIQSFKLPPKKVLVFELKK